MSAIFAGARSQSRSGHSASSSWREPGMPPVRTAIAFFSFSSSASSWGIVA
jgi:hypothetical protein